MLLESAPQSVWVALLLTLPLQERTCCPAAECWFQLPQQLAPAGTHQLLSHTQCFLRGGPQPVAEQMESMYLPFPPAMELLSQANLPQNVHWTGGGLVRSAWQAETSSRQRHSLPFLSQVSLPFVLGPPHPVPREPTEAPSSLTPAPLTQYPHSHSTWRDHFCSPENGFPL